MGTPLRPAEKMKYLLALTLLSTVLAQETFYCPDGWHLYDGRAGCSCFWLAEYESVTRDDADVLCSFHEAWVAELDSPAINYWLKSELLKITDVGQFTQFWLGGFTNERHNENAPGEWFWPHANKTVECLTGLRVSLTISRDRTASPWRSSTTP